MMNVDIKWDTQRQLEQLAEAQKYIDRQCIELMEKYTPFRTGALVQSVVRGTKIGSGHIVYNSPYARYQYLGLYMVRIFHFMLMEYARATFPNEE